MKSYVNKIKGNLSLYTTRKTSNLLDGSYRSIYKGKSMNFDDLREYIPGDNVKDIDWKASSRSKNLLVKQYIAEKKHNVLLVIDTNRKMLGASSKQEIKKEIALMSAGTLGYIAIKNNDVVSAIYSNNQGIVFFPFKSRYDNLEIMLSKCEHDINDKNNSNINKTLEYIRTNIYNRMLIMIVTDIEGLDNIKESYLKELSIKNDIFIINISDTYLFGDNIYNIDNNIYVSNFFTKNKKLFKEEQEMRQELYKKTLKKFQKYKIVVKTINECREIPYKFIELLEERKYGSRN